MAPKPSPRGPHRVPATCAGLLARASAGLVATLLLLLSAGCIEKDEAADRARLEAKEAEIDRMIADRSCAGDASCRVIAFGAKPCGGPWKYKIYSAEHVDTLALRVAVADYNAFNRELNQRYGWVSDCSIAPVPQVACSKGVCEEVAP